LHQTVVSKQVLFDDGEKNCNNLIERFSLLVNFKFKCLDQAFERPKARNFVAHVCTDQSLLNLKVKWRQALSSGTLVPILIVVLCNVPDHVFKLSDDALVA
jgi:hypothetical protein